MKFAPYPIQHANGDAAIHDMMGALQHVAKKKPTKRMTMETKEMVKISLCSFQR